MNNTIEKEKKRRKGGGGKKAQNIGNFFFCLSLFPSCLDFTSKQQFSLVFITALVAWLSAAVNYPGLINLKNKHAHPQKTQTMAPLMWNAHVFH